MKNDVRIAGITLSMQKVLNEIMHPFSGMRDENLDQ